jgi:hypothetical protein
MTSAGTPPIGRALLRFAGWGALWGLALGLGLLAPGLLLSHRLRPRTITEWLFLDACLSLLFAVGGAVIAMPSMLLVTDIAGWFGRKFRDWSWAVGLATGPILVLANAVLAELIRRYSSLLQESVSGDPPIATVTGVAMLLGMVLCSWLAYRTIATLRVRPPIALLTSGLLLVTGIELANLPSTVPVAPPVVEATSLSPVSGRQNPNPAPLLMIGLDGGNWTAIDRVMGAGKLPAFGALASRGLRGDMEALWPPFWSAAAWGAILTGYDRQDSGMYEDLSIEAPGLPLFQAPLMMHEWYYPLLGVRRALVETGLIRLRVPPREALAKPPFWELLALSGHQTAVIRLPYSYPADRQGGALVISDWVGSDWQVLGVNTDDDRPYVAPANEAEALLGAYAPLSDLDRRIESEFFPGGMPVLSDAGRSALEELRRGFTLDVQTFAAARHVVHAHPGFNVALYLGGWDTANHALWRYGLPERGGDPRSRDEVAALGGVLDRYLIFLDRNIQQLLAAFAAAPNVVIVSDHGFAEGWHDKHAMFLASGPGVPFYGGAQTLSYFDVVPTLLDLQGLAAPPSLAGRSVLVK